MRGAWLRTKLGRFGTPADVSILILCVTCVAQSQNVGEFTTADPLTKLGPH